MVGTTDTVTSLDPAGAYDAGSWAVYSNVYQSLLTFEAGSTTPVPDAASTCGFLGTSLTAYQCTLREGLTFANGREVTAQDVKYSFDRMLGIAADVGPAPLFPTLESVTADDRSVVFHLDARDATFPQKLATGAGAIVDRDRYPAQGLREDAAVDGSAVRPRGVPARRPRPAGAQPALPGRQRPPCRVGRGALLRRRRAARRRLAGRRGRRDAPPAPAEGAVRP